MSTRMSREEFKEAVIAMLAENFEGEVEAKTIRKSHDEYEGIVILGIDGAVPVVNIDLFYARYLMIGDIESIFTEILSLFDLDVPEEVSILKNGSYEDTKDILLIRLGPDDPEYYKDKPHRHLEDMIVSYYFSVDNESVMIPVNNSMAEQYGVSEETLYNDALANSEKKYPAVIVNLGEELGRDESPLTMLSNSSKFRGAAALLYPSVKEKLKDKQYYVLPSSIHEVLLLEDEVTPEEMLESVITANETVLEPDEVLAYHVYQMNNGVFSTVI